MNSTNDLLKVQNANLWQGVNGINNPYPVGFRLPTALELDEELATWSSQNASGVFASPLKLAMVAVATANPLMLVTVVIIGLVRGMEIMP